MSKEKQIEEMAEELRHSCEGECFKNKDGFVDCEVCKALLLYNAGYRKQTGRFFVKENGDIVPIGQSEGEWIYVNGDVGYDEYSCSVCGENVAFYDEEEKYTFCPNCGAKMKGGAG